MATRWCSAQSATAADSTACRRGAGRSGRFRASATIRAGRPTEARFSSSTSNDGRILYYLSNRDGFFNVWGRRFSPSAGRPQKEPFRVTTLRGDGRMISPENIREVEIAVAGNRLVVPLTDVSSQIWLLENVDR